MKTREEIEKEYIEGCRAVWAAYEPQLNAISAAEAAELDALNEKRKAALAELDDPVARLIAAARNVLADQIARDPEHDRLCLICRRISDPDSRMPLFHNQDCSAADLRDAIDYAEQRRVQG